MDEKTFLIVGANGQLGRALQKKYPAARAVDIEDLDITDRARIENYDWSKIKVILNAAAYTNVDGAETPKGKVAAQKINEQAVGYLADIANQKDLVLVHISTDYVFDGAKKIHSENEIVKPLGVYGKTKAAGDKKAAKAKKYYIVRVSWLIGEGANFARSILAAAKTYPQLKVVADQFGRPTFTSELVRVIDFLLNTGAPYGAYNGSNSGDTVSWADFAREILQEAGSNTKVEDTTATQYFAGKLSSKRPVYSTLDLSKLQALGYKSHDWRDDLRQYIRERTL